MGKRNEVSTSALAARRSAAIINIAIVRAPCALTCTETYAPGPYSVQNVVHNSDNSELCSSQ